MTTLKTILMGPMGYFGLTVILTAVGMTAWAESDSAKNSQQTFLKAVESVKAQHWTEGRAGFRQVLKNDPENLKAHFYMGEIEYYTHHLSEAEGYFRWVNFHDSHMPVNHYYLGRLDYDEKHYSQALSEMETADQLDSQIAIVHYYLGLIHYRQNDVAGAQKELTRAVDLDPSSSKAHYALAFLFYRDLHQKDPALAEADAAMKGDSDARMRAKAQKLKKQIKSGKNLES